MKLELYDCDPECGCEGGATWRHPDVDALIRDAQDSIAEADTCIASLDG